MKNILQKFDFNDITLVPRRISYISSRSQCNVYDNNKLKLICSPMDTVIDDNNVNIFNQLGILTCSIRKQHIDLNQPDYTFISIGLDQFQDIINNYNLYGHLYHGQGLLVDIANAHQNKLFDLTKSFKDKFSNIPLMIGNIANPETYNKYCEILTSNDYLRCGIGGGCFTPDALVYTKKGLKSLNDIKIDDEVKTHTNSYNKVSQKHIYDKSEILLKINDMPLCTKNHEFYVINKIDKRLINDNNYTDYAFWVKAEELNKELHFLIKL